MCKNYMWHSRTEGSRMLYLKQDDISLTVPSDLNLQISVPLMGVSCIIYPYICLNASPTRRGPTA